MKYILYQIKSNRAHKGRFILVNDAGEEWRYHQDKIIKHNGNYKSHRFCIKAIKHELVL